MEASIASRITTAGRSAGGQTISAPDQWVGPSIITRCGSSSLTCAAELVELGEVDRAVLVDPVVEQGLALGDGGDDREERQVVDVEARERHRVDLVERRVQRRTAAVVMSTRRVWPLRGDVLLGAVVAGSPSPRAVASSISRNSIGTRRMVISRLGDDRGGEQGHRLDRVLAGRVVDVDVDLVARRCTVRVVVPMPSTVDAELLQEEAEVLDHVVGRGVADDGGAGVQRGGHQGVLGDGVAALGEHDRAASARSPRSTWAW